MDILNNGFVVIQIKMLEYHSHMTTVDVDITFGSAISTPLKMI